MLSILAAVLFSTTLVGSVPPTSTALLGSVAPASTAAQNIYQEHNNLISALQRNGISVHLDSDMCQPGLSGFYHSPSKSLALCVGGSREMNEENMDTLRHEAIHAIQDCKDGVQGNRGLYRVLQPGVVEQLASQHGVNLDRIAEVYRGNGQSDEVVSLEFEAFTGAAAMSAGTIARALNNMCAR